MVIIRPSPKSKIVRAVLKGAPEVVLPLCTKVVSSITGEEEILKVAEQSRILNDKIINEFCKEKGLKSIVYAYKDLDADDWDF